MPKEIQIRKVKLKSKSYFIRKFSLEPVTKPKLGKGLSLSPSLPDLVCVAYSDAYDNQDYVITAKVGNVGGAKSGRSLVYVNAISHVPHDGVNEIRIQLSAPLPELNPGDIHNLPEFRFSLRDMHAKEVDQFIIIVDPKDMVKESRENNNTVEWDWPY